MRRRWCWRTRPAWPSEPEPPPLVRPPPVLELPPVVPQPELVPQQQPESEFRSVPARSTPLELAPRAEPAQPQEPRMDSLPPPLGPVCFLNRLAHLAQLPQMRLFQGTRMKSASTPTSIECACARASLHWWIGKLRQLGFISSNLIWVKEPRGDKLPQQRHFLPID